MNTWNDDELLIKFFDLVFCCGEKSFLEKEYKIYLLSIIEDTYSEYNKLGFKTKKVEYILSIIEDTYSEYNKLGFKTKKVEYLHDFIVNLSDEQLKFIATKQFEIYFNKTIERIEESIIKLTQHPAYPYSYPYFKRDIEVNLNKLEKISINDEKYMQIIDNCRGKLKMIEVFQ